MSIFDFLRPRPPVIDIQKTLSLPMTRGKLRFLAGLNLLTGESSYQYCAIGTILEGMNLFYSSGRLTILGYRIHDFLSKEHKIHYLNDRAPTQAELDRIRKLAIQLVLEAGLAVPRKEDLALSKELLEVARSEQYAAPDRPRVGSVGHKEKSLAQH
jgi:hypothetical protein